LAEAVAFGERRGFLSADAIDQAIEMVAQPGIGPGPRGRLEQDRDGQVELATGLVEVAVRQLTLTGGVVTFGCGDERGDGIECGGARRGSGRGGLCGRRWRRGHR